MERKEDKRVRRTKKRLRQALVRLMQRQAFASITVTEVVREADLTRGTFYAHYRDVSDLRERLEDGIVADCRALLEDVRQPAGAAAKSVPARMVDYVQDNRETVTALLRADGREGLGRKLICLLEEWYMGFVPCRTAEDGYIARFVATGVVGLLERWVTEPQPMPPNELIELIARLLTPVLRQKKEKKHPAYRF